MKWDLANLFEKEQKLALKLKQRLQMQMGFYAKWLVLPVVIVSVSAYGDASSNEVTARRSLEKTRAELREQGFKTDLADFDFATAPGSRDWDAILKAIAPSRNVGPFVDHPELMEATGSNSVIVVWEQDSLRRQTPSWPDASYELTWDDFADAVNQSQPQIDAACAAILSGPIQFNLDASAGNSMLLPGLAFLKNLTQMLNDRAMLALHDGNRGAAWTNMMAATRLVTAWNPEPVEVSHRVRLSNAKLAFKATWQVLQTNGWTDNQLARLQHEWETADLLSRLSEIQAFRRACDLKALESDKPASQTPESGMYEDAKRLLLFYRDREIEYRNAVQAGTWMQMRQMPGVTNEFFFEPKHRCGRFAIAMSVQHHKITMGVLGEGISLLAQAAQAEAERRVTITALALERYRGKYKRYPEALQALAPEFLKSVTTDFMTGNSLHYRVAEDGHFLLYSVGLDCVDNGGRIGPIGKERDPRLTNPKTAVPGSDIVWPLATPSAQVVAFRKQQAQAEAQRDAQQKAESEARAQADEQRAEALRKAAMKELLAKKPSLGKEPIYEGIPLSSWVIKFGQAESYFHGAPKDAIAAIRAIGSNAVPFLLEWMPHLGAEELVDGFPDWSAVEGAWWALGSEGKSAIPTLARNINRPQHSMNDFSGWTESAKVISYLGPEAIVPMLTAATNMAGQHELWELLHNFRNLGTNGAPAIPALIHWANDPDYWVRCGVVSALGGIGKRPDLAVPVLLNALEHDTNSMVRRDAVEALGSFANDSEAVLPALTKALKSLDWETRGGALSGLGKIQNKPEVVVPLISPFLYDSNNNVLQRSAAYALRDLGSEAGYRALLQASNAPSSWPGIGDIIYEVQEKMRRPKSQ